MDDAFSTERFLREQLDLTRQTWQRLQEHGVSDGVELKLDFFYAAPTNALATELSRFFERETDYETRVTADQDQWIVRGHTQRAPLTLAILQQWVDWMISAGLHFGCVFDGWGAEAP